jgi:hypothetical protein
MCNHEAATTKFTKGMKSDHEAVTTKFTKSTKGMKSDHEAGRGVKSALDSY